MTIADFSHEKDARTRAVISTAIRETLFVEAGAGTGKTRSLVDRVVALVVGGIPVEKIAAITFTERAAAELRDRVRTGLEEYSPPDDRERAFLEAALEALDRAQISTIHAFCQSVLRSSAAEAAVDPDFDVHDPVLTERRRQERWRSFLERIGDEPQALEVVDRVLSLGLAPRDLEGLALGLAQRADLAELLEGHPFVEQEPIWPDIRTLLGDLQEAASWNTSPTDALLPRVTALLSLVENIATASSEREAVLASGAGLLGLRWGVGANAGWGGRASEVRDVCKDVAERLTIVLAQLRSVALAALLPYIVAFVREDEQARSLGGTLTFDDLILRVRDLLRRSPEARRSLRNRYEALLIDEFQDTDPLQVEIAQAFAQDPDTGQFEAGRLFVVGDPKQSIYRFRRADMAVYADTRKRMEAEGGRFLQLALNKRSRGPILDWVNSVFSYVIGTGEQPDVQPPYNSITTDRASDLRGPGVAWFGDATDAAAREVRSLEAEHLAALCRQAIETEHWQVAERDGTVRDATYRDIAILIPRRTGLVSLERALAAARIPFRVEGGSLIYRTQELRDLINCLTAIDDPADEVAIVGALRSPAFACSDVDLAQFKAGGGRFNYRSEKNDSLSGPVADGLRVLATYHSQRHDASLAAFIERFAADRGQVEIGILDQGDRNTFRRVRFLVQQARRFEQAGPESLRAFVTWVERQAGAQMLDNEGAGVDDDEDAVRILTIHGAKGLEFPIVFLAGLSAAPNRSYPTFLRDYANSRFAVRAGTKGGNRVFSLGDYDALSALEETHEKAEIDRVLYVGATRARDHLIASLFHRARQKEAAAQRLIGGGAQMLAPNLVVNVTGASQTGVRPFQNVTVELPPDSVTPESFANDRATVVEKAKQTQYTSATAIKAAGTVAPADSESERTDETEPWSRGRAGTRVGRAVHAAIQSLPLDATDSDISSFARAQAVAEAVPDRARDVERLVRWVLRESDAWGRAMAAPKAIREVPFALQVDGKVLEGFIDLVIQSPDGIEIVDWKTDQISAGQVDARLDDYRLQAGLYVYGLEEATNQRVTRVTYVFASPQIERTVGDPAALALSARERLIDA